MIHPDMGLRLRQILFIAISVLLLAEGVARASAESTQPDPIISIAVSIKDISDIICGLHAVPTPAIDDFVADDVSVKKMVEIKAASVLTPRCHLPSQDKLKSLKTGFCCCIKSGNGDPVSALSNSQFEDRVLLVSSRHAPFDQTTAFSCILADSHYTSLVFSPDPPPPTAA